MFFFTKNWFGFSSQSSWSSISCAYLASYRRLAEGDGGWGELFKIGVGEGYSSNEWLNLMEDITRIIRWHFRLEVNKIYSCSCSYRTWVTIPPYIRALCNWNTIDFIHDARHLCTRSRVDGIKAMSCGFSGGKQVTKFASTSNRGWVCLFYQNETTISWSCKTYVSDFSKNHVIIVCHEDIYSRYCIQKSDNDHFHPYFDIIVFKIKRASFPVV